MMEVSIKSTETNTKRITSFYIKLFISITSVLVSFVVSINTFNYPGEKYLFLLPLTYSVLLLIFPAMWKYKANIGLAILNVVIFMRYVILPLFRSLTVNEPAIRGLDPTYQGIHYGLVIMLVELFISFFIVQILARKFYINKHKIHHFRPLKSKLLLYTTALMGIAFLFIFPNLSERYNFFLKSGQITSPTIDIPLSGLISLITDLLLVILPIIVLNFLKIRYDKNPSFKYVFFSILSILPAITIIKGTSRFSVIVPAIAFLVIMLKLYPKFRKQIIFVIVTAALLIFAVFTNYLQTEHRQNTNDFSVNYLAHTLGSYMSGPDNMGRVVDLKSEYGSFFTLETLKNDLINNVAILSNLSETSNTTPYWFNYKYYGNHISKDQIIPLSGQSYIHFGVIGMPLLLSITLILMMFFDSRIKYENRIEYVYLYVYLTVYMSMAMMVSFGSIYPLFTNLFIPTIILFKLNRKIKL